MTTPNILDMMTPDSNDVDPSTERGVRMEALAPGMYSGTWKRLHDGSWGARVVCVAGRPEIGAAIAMARASGTLSTHTIESVNRTGAPNVFRCRVSAAIVAAPVSGSAGKLRGNAHHVYAVDPAPAVVTGPENFNVRAAASRGDLVAGASAEGNGILTGFSGRGSMTRATLLATLATAGFPQDWAPAAKTRHAQAGNVLGALNHLGLVCRADSKRRKSKLAKGTAEAELDLMVAADARQDGNHYASDALVRRAGGIDAVVPTWTARWEVAAGRGREAEVGAAFGTVVMIATLDQNGELHLECDNEALVRRVREDFQARVDAEEFQAADVTAWLGSILVSKFHAARLGGNWYVRRQYASDAERLLKAFSLRWGKEWMLPALPVATTEQLCDGLANGLVAEATAIHDDFVKLANDGALTSRRAEGLYGDIKAIAVRVYGLITVIGEERANHVVTVQLAAFADNIAKQVSKPLASFASVARALAPRR